MSNWTIDIPKDATPCLVLVKNIAKETNQDTIKDFFSFCGIITAFEMKLHDEHQEALIHFEKESAAKTATLLSQAVVDDSAIQVEPYFKDTPPQDPVIDQPAPQQQEVKSVTRVMSELLASGYVLTDSVLAKGAEFDGRHNVSTRVNGYLNKIGVDMGRINQKFQKSPAAATAAAETTTTDKSINNSPSRMHNLINSRAGLKVHGLASKVAGKVSSVHEEAKKIAAEKKKTSGTTISSDTVTK
ncbi:hypothetical protein K501DRAFT_215175 [Backusella circina FSU 941]|nr:hypothetical protein K501DRAFT_215175 [Backusella circina FSU 941]